MTMHRTQTNTISTIVYFSLLLASAAYLAQPIFEPNFFADVALGHQLLAAKILPHSHLLTAIGDGQFWAEPRWLTAVLIAKSEILFGERGLIVLRLLSIALLLLALGQVCLRLSGNAVLAGLIALLTSAGLLVYPDGALNALPQAFLVFTLGGMFCLLKTKRVKPVLLMLTCFAVLLSNLDAQIFLWAIILAAFLIFPRASRRQKLQLLFVLAVAAICNPYLGAELASAGRMFLTDLQAELVFRLHPPSIFYYDVAALIILALLFVLCAHYRLMFLEKNEALCSAVLLLAATASRTYVPPALLAISLIVCTLWGRAAGTGFGNFSEALTRLGNTLRSISAVGVIWVLWCLIIVEVAKLIQAPMLTVMLPQPELDAILAEAKRPKIFHSAAIGSYVAYRMAPLDARALTDPTARALDLQRYLQVEQFFSARPGWETVVSEIAPDYLLVGLTDPIGQVLKLDPHWKELNTPENSAKYARPWLVFAHRPH